MNRQIKGKSNETIAHGSEWEQLRASVSKTKDHQVPSEQGDTASQSCNDSKGTKSLTVKLIKITVNAPPSSASDLWLPLKRKDKWERPAELGNSQV